MSNVSYWWRLSVHGTWHVVEVTSDGRILPGSLCNSNREMTGPVFAEVPDDGVVCGGCRKRWIRIAAYVKPPSGQMLESNPRNDAAWQSWYLVYKAFRTGTVDLKENIIQAACEVLGVSDVSELAGTVDGVVQNAPSKSFP